MGEASPSQPARRRRFRRWLSRALLLLLLAGLVAALVVALLPKPQLVEIAPATRGALQVSVDEDGRTRVKDRYLLSAPLAGTVARIDLQPGDPIEAGDEVALLMPIPSPLLDSRSQAQAQAALAGAEASARQVQAIEARVRAALAFAKAEFAGQKQLAKSGTISTQELRRARLELRTKREELASAGFGVRAAKHQVQMLRAALGRLGRRPDAHDQLVLRSPVDGIVLELLREDEGVVPAGAPLVEVGDPRSLELVVDVLSTDAVRIRAGAKARVLRWGAAQDLAARVRRVEPKAFTRFSSLGVEEQRVNVILDLLSPPQRWRSLGDGYRVEVSMVVWEAAEVLRVPVSAVFKQGGSWAVFRVDGDRARLQPVQLGERNGFDAQVLSGLRVGQRVVLYPGERVTDGARVQAR